MCFNATVEQTTKLRKSRQRTFYKLVYGHRRTDNTWSDYAPRGTAAGYYTGTVYSHRYYVGAPAIAEGRKVKVTTRNRKMVAGIYVYRKLDDAKGSGDGYNRVIAVRAEPADLLGADATRAAFAKVKVLREVPWQE